MYYRTWSLGKIVASMFFLVAAGFWWRIIVAALEGEAVISMSYAPATGQALWGHLLFVFLASIAFLGMGLYGWKNWSDE